MLDLNFIFNVVEVQNVACRLVLFKRLMRRHIDRLLKDFLKVSNAKLEIFHRVINSQALDGVVAFRPPDWALLDNCNGLFRDGWFPDAEGVMFVFLEICHGL